MPWIFTAYSRRIVLNDYCITWTLPNTSIWGPLLSNVIYCGYDGCLCIACDGIKVRFTSTLLMAFSIIILYVIVICSDHMLACLFTFSYWISTLIKLFTKSIGDIFAMIQDLRHLIALSSTAQLSNACRRCVCVCVMCVLMSKRILYRRNQWVLLYLN